MEATGQTQHFALGDFNKSTEGESKHVSPLKIQKGWQGGLHTVPHNAQLRREEQKL